MTSHTDKRLTRRQALRSLGVLCSAAAAGAPATKAAGKPAVGPDGNRPNIIFILTDDQRWDALGCMGHPFLKTPSMDRLAKEGVMFANAFVTTSLCSPSRASFLTGCYAHTHRVYANSGRDPDPKLPTFPQLLRKAGYETAFIGKWHMAGHAGPRPGFDRWVSFSGQGKYFNCRLNVDGKQTTSTKHMADELGDYAVRFVSKERSRPFMMYLSHKSVHAPFTPPKRHATLYGDKRITSRHNPKDRLSDKVKWGRKMPSAWQKDIRNYMATVTAIDDNLARVLEALGKRGILDNTAIVFAGDNGYFHGEHGGMWDKRAAYEPSMRIPILMRYPPLARAGWRPEALVLNIDVAPTLLALAGVDAPPAMQGRSWLGVLAGKDKGRESFFYEYFREGDARFDRPGVFAVRTHKWKYITYPSLDRPVHELYDLAADPEELNNLAGSKDRAGVLREMQAEMQRLKKETAFPAAPANLARARAGTGRARPGRK